jgi:Cu-Zn family superoxide dismutase
MTNRNGILRRWRAALAFGLVSLLALAAAPAAMAQDATPAAGAGEIDVTVKNADGTELGVLTFVAVGDTGMVRVVGALHGLEPGEHGLHIHEVGICDPAGDEPFSSAGGHFNPTGAMHGPGPEGTSATPMASPMAMGESHAGDLGNITVEDDGTVFVTVTTDQVSLDPGAPNSLADADGSAIVVHQDADDLMTDPSGNSGPRIGCGVIFAGSGATPVAMDARN